MVVQDEFGVDSVEMIWQRLPNISKHPVSRCGRTPRQPHSTHSTHSIPVTVRFCDVLRCCFARVSAQNFHPPGSKSKTDSEDTIFLLRSAFVVFETLSSLSFAHPEFTETAVPADETNLSNARPRFGLCPTELESATAAGHVETMESMRISRL